MEASYFYFGYFNPLIFPEASLTLLVSCRVTSLWQLFILSTFLFPQRVPGAFSMLSILLLCLLKETERETERRKYLSTFQTPWREEFLVLTYNLKSRSQRPQCRCLELCSGFKVLPVFEVLRSCKFKWLFMFRWTVPLMSPEVLGWTLWKEKHQISKHRLNSKSCTSS